MKNIHCFQRKGKEDPLLGIKRRTQKFRGKIMIYICDYASEYYINDHSKTSLDLALTPEQFHAASAAELYDLIEHLTDRTGA